MRYLVSYDPIPVLARTTIPVLALNGSLDLQVLADVNLPPIQQALQTAGNTRATVKKLAGLNHLFQHAGTGSPAEYGGIAETIAPDVLAQIRPGSPHSDWCTNRGPKNPRVQTTPVHKETPMKLTRIILFAMAVTLPTTWTVAMAGDEAPAEGAPAKEKKGGKKKKEDKPKEEKKAE